MQYRNEILTIIKVSHHFESAFSKEQIYRLLRLKMEYDYFTSVIDGLLSEKVIIEKNGLLFLEDLEKACLDRKQWSRNLFGAHKKYLSILFKLPWIKYVSLTGANSFESCAREDDIDLFVITSANRLWICYLLLVILSKLIRKRRIFCFNYLVDENNLVISERNYFTAVQLVQMIPLYDNDIGDLIIKSNPWVFDFLPNAGHPFEKNNFYSMVNGRWSKNGKKNPPGVLAWLNRKIYQKYYQRLARKFPETFGSGIKISEGSAKLNSTDHQDVYDEILGQLIQKKIAS